MPALSAMRFNPAVAALVTRLKDGGPPQAQTDRCSGHAQASGYMFRCAEDGQAVRSGYRHASVSLSDFPYSVV
jgi:hypothetical protein